jgi:hypothetical protein
MAISVWDHVNPNLVWNDEFSGYIFPTVKSKNILETLPPYSQLLIFEQQLCIYVFLYLILFTDQVKFYSVSGGEGGFVRLSL